MTQYQERAVRFLGISICQRWKIKLYSISVHQEVVDTRWVNRAMRLLPKWLENSTNFPLETYRMATLILHEGREGCFAIVSWWVDENMLQLHVYQSLYNGDEEFRLISDQGLVSCVWEMAILWHERNAWVTHVLQKADSPDFDGYMSDVLNGKI